MARIRCENCDEPILFGHPHQEERHSTQNGNVNVWTAWLCSPAPWRERALKAEAELAELKAKRKKKPPKFEPIPDYGDHMTWDDFVGAVRTGGFIDYDGHGNLATATECSDKNIVPSQITRPSGYNKPSWVTHVVWYNK
jgi:hypothetical protein